MIKTPDISTQHTNNLGLSVSEQKTMYDLLDSAMSDGAYGTIPAHMMVAARKNPLLDWNAPLKEVLTKRTIQIGNREYSTCLVGIPLHGDLGMAFEQVLAVKEILKEAQSTNLMSKEDGLIFLDQPLPRSTIQLMSIEDMYNLTPRLFERGVRANPNPVLDAKIMEGDVAMIDSAMMVGLLYWKADKPKPHLLTSVAAQEQLAKIVERHMAFERATPSCSAPSIQSSRMEPFLDATITSSRHITKRYLDNLVANNSIVADCATFNVVTDGAPWGEYQIEILLQAVGALGECTMTLCLDELRDGNVSDTLGYLVQELNARGVSDCRIGYQQMNYSSAINDVEEIVRSPISLH